MTYLLDENEPAATGVERAGAASRFLLTCEHAGSRIPASLADLGVPAAELGRHIAWDIGALAVARGLSAALDATLVFQRYSRLVIDCNRRPRDGTSILSASDGTEIPGNEGLSDPECQARIDTIFTPYHGTIEHYLAAREAHHGSVVLISVHSFTPALRSRPAEPRPWHIGVLAGTDRRLAEPLIRILSTENELCIGDNQPYGVNLSNDHTIPVHGDQRGTPHVELEIRQDLIDEVPGQRRMIETLADALPRAVTAAGV